MPKFWYIYNRAMKRLRLLISAAAISISALCWGQAPAPVERRTALAFSPESAPEVLVYRFFFAELAAAQSKAGELAAQGRNSAPLRTAHQRLTGLEAAEFELLSSVAAETVSAQRATMQRAQALLQSAATPADRPENRCRTDAPPRRGRCGWGKGVESLRALLGPEKFAEFDRRVRRHVAPHLRLYRVSPPAGNPASGGQ